MTTEMVYVTDTGPKRVQDMTRAELLDVVRELVRERDWWRTEGLRPWKELAR